jgi:hypothetical protein
MDAQLGNNIQTAYVNMITNAEEKMQASFSSISKLQKLEEIIRTSMNVNNETSKNSELEGGSYSISMVEEPLSALVLAEKQNEKERLAAAIQQLDGDVRRTKDVLSRLKAQVQNEIAAVTEECQKMSLAAAQIGRTQVQ